MGPLVAAALARDELGDRVAMRGWAAPLPGQRFVVFDDEGRHGALEATGERCPPGHEDCIVCADDGRGRVHWARLLEGKLPTYASAVGSFVAGEKLPSPKLLDGDWARRGRWLVRDHADLDGDGEVDW